MNMKKNRFGISTFAATARVASGTGVLVLGTALLIASCGGGGGDGGTPPAPPVGSAQFSGPVWDGEGA